ncbi:MAG: ChbG/HpnK family deacetylase [Bacteroidia bacterium]
MKHLIVTADDYGVFPAINKGVIEAAKSRRLNSVSVLANFAGNENYPGSLDNLEHLLNETSDLPDELEIGCHLTITSGKPLTGDKMSFACDSQGYFLGYTEMKNYKNPEELAAIKEELCEQVKQLESRGNFKVMHLTNHHNSLTLLPHHFSIYMEVARLFHLPMRSTRVRPEGRQNFYLRFLNFKLRDDMNPADRADIERFAREVEDYFRVYNAGIKAPEVLDSRNYGPISFIPTRLVEYLLVAQKKQNFDKLYRSFINAQEDSLELLLHLAKGSGALGVDHSHDLDYPGIDRGYFDSRVAELSAVMGYDFNWENVEIKGWREL